MSAPAAAPAVPWQELALTDLEEDVAEAFAAIVSSVPEGRRFSVNDVRHRLDAAGVPERQRAGLFLRARHAGLIEPVVFEQWGVRTPYRVPSTGTSAHRAHVQVYRRLPARGDDHHPPPAGGG